jgi:hypothetical protein
MGGGIILLGDNSADGALVLWPIRSQRVGVEIQLDSLLYTHVFNYMYTQLRLALDIPERNCYIILGVYVLCTVAVNTGS